LGGLSLSLEIFQRIEIAVVTRCTDRVSVYVVVMSDLAIRLRKMLAAFGTRGGGVKVRLLIARGRFHVLGIGHDFTDDLVFV